MAIAMMVKTQVQFPDHLYEEAKRVAAENEMSFAEVVRRIIDVRLALTLHHAVVTEFATSNPKDFEGLGFQRVWNPLQAA